MQQQLPFLGVWLTRIQSLLLCLVGLASLCAPAIVQFAGLSTDPSLIDNRYPAPFPTLPKSFADVAKFRDGIEKFVDDNFGLRAELVKLNWRVHSWIGVSTNPNLTIGKDGWVFLDRNSALDQFRGLNRFTEAELDAWIDHMDRYRRWLENRGIAFVVLIAPNQQTIYPEYLPGFINKVWPETRLDQISRRLKERKSELNLVDPRPNLWAARKTGLLYHRYENHWNDLGGFAAYSALMSSLGQRFPNANILRLSDFTVGSAKHTWYIPWETEVAPTLNLKIPSSITEKKPLFPGTNLTAFEITTRLNHAPTALLYGDSFGDPGLLRYVQETFKSTMMVFTSQGPFPDELIKKKQPDVVILQMVERYLASESPDNRYLDSEFLTAHAPPLHKMLRETAGPIGGFVDAIKTEGGELRLRGWAVDPKANTPAKSVYAYLGDRVISAAKPSISRPEVTRGMESHLAGFEMTIVSEVERRSPRRLRFFTESPSNNVYELVIDAPIREQLEQLLEVGEAPPFDRVLRSSKGAATGTIEGLKFEDGKVRFFGWAVDPSANTPANAIYAYLGDRLVGAAVPRIARPELTAGMTDQAVGFQLTVPRNVDKQVKENLRFFTVNPSNSIYELSLDGGVKSQIESWLR
jgi:hypothetical protein